MDDVVSFALTIVAHLAGVAFVLLVGFLLAVAMRRLARRLLAPLTSALGPSMVRLLCSAIYYLILVLAIGLSLITLGVPTAFVVTASGVIVVILALALQQSIANFAATIIFLMFQPFKHGDL